MAYEHSTFEGLQTYGRVPELVMKQQGVVRDAPYARTPYDEPAGQPYTWDKEALRGVHAKTELNTRFFSRENFEYLQEQIRYRVYQQSGNQYIVDRQNDDELKIVMRSIYMTYARHRAGELEEELKDLNEHVLAYCVKDVLTAVDHYMKYLNTLAYMPQQPARPVNPSMSGTKGSYKSENIKFF